MPRKSGRKEKSNHYSDDWIIRDQVEKTKHYKLLKPGVDDFYDVGDFNQNVDIVDQELKRVEDKTETCVTELQSEILNFKKGKADLESGKVPETQLPIGTTSHKGIVQLSTSISNGSSATAATSGAVKQAVERVEMTIHSHVEGTDSHNGWAGEWVDLPDNSVTDFNQLINSGVYQFALRVSVLNEPYAGVADRRMIVIVRGQGWLTTQEIYYVHGHNMGRKYYREYSDSWSEWRELATMGMISNKNLLLNWDFHNPVNQRGQKAYAVGAYTIDRWISDSDTIKLSVEDGCINMTTASNGYGLRQNVENGHLFNGSTLTLSVIVKGNYRINISRYSKELKTIHLAQSYGFKSDWSVVSCTAVLEESEILEPEQLRIIIRCNDAASSVQFKAAKLELGPISTLANDPPANYGEQLALCQRYFWRYKASGDYDVFAIGEFANSKEFIMMIDFGIPMRCVPTVAHSGTIGIIVWVGSIKAVSSIYPLSFAGKTGAFIANVESGAIAGQTGALRPLENTTTYIDFDAEIY